MKDRIKDFIYKIDEFGFSQHKRLRKWYGGEWTKIAFRGSINMEVWLQGKPHPDIKFDEILEVENW